MTTAPLPLSRHQPWDDQAGSALQQRLGPEATFLETRLPRVNPSSFPAITPPSLVAFPPTSSPSNNPSTSEPSPPRTRTESSPLSSEPGPSRSRAPETPSFIPSRIPRPRSRSGVPSSPPESQTQHMTPPSSIPVSKNRSTSPKLGRESPGLKQATGKDGYIKHELPPFAIFPKAGQGSGLAVRPSSSRQDSSGSEGRGGGDRLSAPSILGATGPSRPPTGSSLGLGQPSTRKVSAPAQIKARSPSDRNPTAHAPRSASLNMLASPSSSSTPTSSRLGVAAHFIPPETTYTPPKGVNWDEVVLPTVARKLGIGEGERAVGEEGDLAVEWDRDGTPIKWIKRTTSPRLDADASGIFTDHRSSPSSFSPTFEPSPENPLRAELAGTARNPPLRQKRSGEKLELHPLGPTLAPGLRTTLHPDTNPWATQGHPDSPSPVNAMLPGASDSLAPVSSRSHWQTERPWQSRSASSASRSQSHQTQSYLAHDPQLQAYAPSSSPRQIPSSLRAEASPVASRQASRSSLRQSGYQNPRTPPVIQVQAATPGTIASTSQGINGQEQRSGSMNQAGPNPLPASDRLKKDKEEVGKGCGCVIM